MPIGERIGSQLTKTRKLGLLIAVALIMGIAIAVANLISRCSRTRCLPSEHGPYHCGRSGRGTVSRSCAPAHYFQKKLAIILILLYAAVFGLAIFTSRGFPCRGVQFGRRDHRSHYRTVYSFARRGRCGGYAADERAGGQFWPCGHLSVGRFSR